MRFLPYWSVVWILRAFFLLGFSVRVEGSHNLRSEGSCILCSNHVSWLDPPLLAATSRRPVHFMAKRELFEVPVLGALLSRILAFPVDRGRGDRRAIKRALQVLGEGECVGMFPEGTRAREGVPRVFLRGAAYLAVRSGAPIIPIGISGSYGFRSRMTIRVGEPIIPSSLGRSGAELGRAVGDLTAEVFEEIEVLSSVQPRG